MPFTIDDPDVERLARELAAVTRQSVQRAVGAALRERRGRIQAHRATPATATPDRADTAPPARFGSIAEIQAYLAALPELDARTPDEILGYGALGLPH